MGLACKDLRYNYLMLKKIIQGLLIGIGIGGILSLLFYLGVFASWQERMTDLLFTPQTASDKIAIIAIDDKSIQAIGRWPWDRKVHADLITKLQTPSSKPKAIGIDISFFEPSDDDQQLAAAIAQAGNVVLAAEEVDGKTLLPLANLTRNTTGFGVVNTLADADGIVRKVATKFDSLYDHFTIAILKMAGEEIETLPPTLRINFVGPPKTFKYYSYVDVLNGTVPTKTFKDKIVLVGATAPDLHDDQMVPTSNKNPMPGVEIHANLVQMFKERRFLTAQTRTLTVGITALFGIMASVITILIPLLPGVIFSTIAVIAYLIYVSSAFDQGQLVNILYPILAIVIALIVDIIFKYLTESRLKAFIRKAFSFYLSEAVLKEVLANPKNLKLGGERRELTVLFSDIKGFTGISEKVEVEKLTSLLNKYLTAMTDIVFANQGVLDKYVGDAVMAFWGAPVESDHAYLACKAALEMMAEVGKLKAEWKSVAGFENFDIRIGINTGEMTVGNMGSNIRFDYTVIGDNVNLGSRLEGINKEYHTNIIISEATYAKLADRVVAQKIDQVAVKGKTKPVYIYELRGLGKTTTDHELLEKFEVSRREYQKGNFPKSLQLFKLLSKKYPNDGPTATYLARLQILTKAKPKNWTGVFTATQK